MYDQLAEELFQILKGFGKELTLFDSNGGRVYDPPAARRMFAEPDKMLLSVEEDGSNSSVGLFLSDSADMPTFEKLINTLRHLSTRYNVLFNVRKYNKKLSPKDFAYASLPVAECVIVETPFKDKHIQFRHDDTINTIFGEGISPLYGSIKTSYQKFGESRLIVKHTAKVNEEKRGSRSRNIHALFVENNQGEKFRFPVVHLSGARAWAQHINQNGSPHNQIGEWIVNNAVESSKLSSINKHIKHNRLTVNEEVGDLQSLIRQRIFEIRCQFNRLSRQRVYPVESLKLNFNRKLDEDQDMKREINRLGILLGIEGDHALAESLMPLVQLTKGEKMATNNSTFRRVVAVENANDLVEALTSEFGYKEGSAWNKNNKNIAFSVPEAFDAAQSYLDFSNSKYKVIEEPFDGSGGMPPSSPPPDKFLAYAQKWLKQATGGENLGHVGDDWSPKDLKQMSGKAVQLATGLKELLTGRLQVHPVAPTMKSSNPRTAAAVKVGQLLMPQAGLQNDMLHNYLSAIYEKMGAGESLTPVEKQVADKCITLVDSITNDVEEDVWRDNTVVESGRSEGDHVSTPKGPGVVTSCDGEWCHVELQHGANEAFMASEIEDANPEKLGTGSMKEISDIDEWFGKFDPFKFLNEQPPEQAISEGSSGSFEMEVSYGGNNDVPATIYYDSSPSEPMSQEQPGAEGECTITSVIIDDSGEDIVDQLDPAELDKLKMIAWDHIDDSEDTSDEEGPYHHQWGDDDPMDVARHADESLDEKVGVNPEKAHAHALDSFEIDNFFKNYGKDFNWSEDGNVDPEDLEYDSSYIVGDIAHYLVKLSDRYDQYEDSGLGVEDFQHEAKALFDNEVKPAMEAKGYVFDSPSQSPAAESDETDESVMVSDELPPAGLIIPGDVQHDFRTDVSSRNIKGGMTQTHPYAIQLARLRSLAGLR